MDSHRDLSGRVMGPRWQKHAPHETGLGPRPYHVCEGKDVGGVNWQPGVILALAGSGGCLCARTSVRESLRSG